MGASVSVCNLTVIVLNVALKHLGPLYYHNQLMPGECAQFKTGQFWFTVEARVWKNGTNDYTDAMVGLPIAGLAQGVAAVAGVIGNGHAIGKLNKLQQSNNYPLREEERETARQRDIDSAKTSTGVVAAVGFVPAVAVGVAGVIVNEIDQVHPSLLAKKFGVFMKPGLTIGVAGGPPASQVDFRNETQIIYMNPEFEPLRIEIP